MPTEKLNRLTDALVENILSTPDEQIVEESREDAREEWQPIITAPRDGTAFLAYWWREHTDGTRYEAAAPYVVAHYMDGRLFPSWIPEKDPPTHWRMLPGPPKHKFNPI